MHPPRQRRREQTLGACENPGDMWRARCQALIMTEIRLKDGGALDGLVTALSAQARLAANLANLVTTVHPTDSLAQFQNWAISAVGQLANHLPRPLAEELIYTRHYYALRLMNGSEAGAVRQMETELRARSADMLVLASDVEAVAARWRPLKGQVIVPDTSVLVQSTSYFDELDWSSELGLSGPVHLVVPIAVVGECDSLKRDHRAREHAREVIKRLGIALPDPRIRVELRTGVTLEVLTDPLDHVPVAVTDNEIVDRALLLKEASGRDVIVVAWDLAMIFRAKAFGLRAVSLPDPLYYDYAEKGATAKQRRGQGRQSVSRIMNSPDGLASGILP